MKKKIAITLLSGGLDSMVSTAIALKKHKVALALTFDYGQRAARREIAAASALCKLWEIPHKVIALKWLGDICGTALVSRKKRIPNHTSKTLSNARACKATAKAVWVPNRNALFVNIAAAYAEAMSADLIVAGFNKEEAATFPDNSEKFVSAVNGSLAISTMLHPKVVSYTQKMTKRDMIDHAFDNDLPLETVWSCYLGGKLQCGECESCVRFLSGLA